MRAPPVLHVGVYNTLVDQKLEHAGVCRITLYSPYWLNNRTGVDLFYQDYSSAPSQPLLCGASFPGDYGEVFVPGTSMTEVVEKDGGSEVGGQGPASFFTGISNGSSSSLKQAVLEYRLVLMNKQESVGLGLGHVKYRKYGNPVPIKTVGNKGSVELRGPPAVQPSSRARKVAQGLKGVAHAGAAVPVAALGQLGAMAGLHRPGSAALEKKRREELLSDSHKSLSARHSMIGDTVADVVSTEPGTMLVRLTSAAAMTSGDKKPRRRGSIRRGTTWERGNASKKSKADDLYKGEEPPSPGMHADDAEAHAALLAMQQVPESPLLGGPEGDVVVPELSKTGKSGLRSSLGHGGEVTAAEGSAVVGDDPTRPQTIFEETLKRTTNVLPSPISRETHKKMMAPVEGQSAQEVAELAAFEAQGTEIVFFSFRDAFCL